MGQFITLAASIAIGGMFVAIGSLIPSVAIRPARLFKGWSVDPAPSA